MRNLDFLCFRTAALFGFRRNDTSQALIKGREGRDVVHVIGGRVGRGGGSSNGGGEGGEVFGGIGGGEGELAGGRAEEGRGEVFGREFGRGDLDGGHVAHHLQEDACDLHEGRSDCGIYKKWSEHSFFFFLN